MEAIRVMSMKVQDLIRMGSALLLAVGVACVARADGLPVIRSPLQSKLVPAGVYLSLNSDVENFASVTVQWYKGGLPISASNGGNGYSITVVALTAANSASYYFTATNSAGTVTSATAVITVVEGRAPYFDTQPSPAITTAGGTVQFSAFTPYDPQHLNVQWEEKRGAADWAPIPNDARYATSSFGQVLRISGVTMDMSGWQYRLRVGNAISYDISNVATLTVNSITVLGAYFGTTDGGGCWSMYVNGATAKFLAYLPDRQSAIITDVTVSDLGVIDGTAIERLAGGSGAWIAIQGQISTTGFGRQVSGTLVGAGKSFAGAFGTGMSAYAITGDFYTAVALEGAAGNVYSMVGPGGDMLSLIVTPSLIDAFRGQFQATSAADWTLQGTSVNGAAVTLSVNVAAHATRASYTPAAGKKLTFSGISADLAPPSRLTNLSVRARGGTGDQTLIVGFVVDGSSAKDLLVRGVGPTLASYGVAGAMPDPRLKVYSATGALLAENDDWGGGAAMRTLFNTLGAFALGEASKDAAVLLSLTGSPYSTHLVSADSQAGVGLVEIYDADSFTGTRLANASARNFVGTGSDILIAGFVISGGAPVRLLVRGVGPTLSNYGVSGAIANPRLEVYNASGVLVAANDDWGGTPDLKQGFKAVGAFDLAGDDSKDAALIITLEPGAYSAQLSGANGATGIGLVEVYPLP